MKWFKGNLLISDEYVDVDLETVHRMLVCTDWAKDRSKVKTEISLLNSLCFSVKESGIQIGFARVISDHGCCSVVLDVVIHPEYRGKGIGSWLIDVISSHPLVLGTAVVLWTDDKVEFYQSCGFTHEDRLHVMRIVNKLNSSEIKKV